MDIFKYDFGLVERGSYTGNANVNITVTGGLFYNEDGTVQTMPMQMSQETWYSLMPHVHKIFIRSS